MEWMNLVLDQLVKMGRLEVARTFSARLKSLMSAGGAGVITAFTAIFKLLVVHAAIPLLSIGLFTSLNFVISFLFIQALGFQLATKQSSLFGVALAEQFYKLKYSLSEFHDLPYFKNEFLLSLRTQALTAGGNLALVLLSGLVISLIFRFASGVPFLDPLAAKSALQSLNPWKSFTLLYATFTGVILWMCTFVGGFIASRFKPFSKSMTTALFNICLGASLALTPLIGKAFDLPLDVRHFALSAGTVALSTASLGLQGALDAGLISAFLGVIAIGFLNFSVSFVLAFLSTYFSKGNHGCPPPACSYA